MPVSNQRISCSAFEEQLLLQLQLQLDSWTEVVITVEEGVLLVCGQPYRWQQVHCCKFDFFVASVCVADFSISAAYCLLTHRQLLR